MWLPKKALARAIAEARNEPECKSRFRREMLLPHGRTFTRSLWRFLGAVALWIVIELALPDIGGSAKVFLAAVAIATALNLGQATGWLTGAKETFAWTHGEEPKHDDDPLARDPELWMRSGSVNDRS